MTSTDKFALKWKGFKENISCNFKTLRYDNNLANVTLVSEDNQYIEAHKVVLCASSQFFMNIFEINRHSHPLIYLKGFQSKYFTSVIDFIYFGEVNVSQDNLEGFLAIAEEIKLKGLDNKIEQRKKIDQEQQTEELDHNERTIPITHTTIPTEVSQVKEEDEILKEKAVDNQLFTNMTSDISQKVDLESTFIAMIYQRENAYTCTVCDKTVNFDKSNKGQSKRVMLCHLESHHINGMTYVCTKCDKTFTSRSALYTHTSRIHNTNWNVKCLICFSIIACKNGTSGLKYHLEKQHKEGDQIVLSEVMDKFECKNTGDRLGARSKVWNYFERIVDQI